MFAVSRIYRQEQEIIQLQDMLTGTVSTILPSCGAILGGFIIEHRGEKLDIIDHYTDEEDFKKNVTAKGFKGCKLSPFACRIDEAIYRFGEEKYTLEKFLLKGSALHGLLYDAEFKVTDIFADEEKATVGLSFKYRGTDKGYPFLYECLVSYTLRADHSLTLLTTIINQDKGLIPIQDGWHPYFSFGKQIDELELEFQSIEILEFDEALIPTGKLTPYREFNSLRKIGGTQFDNCFTLNFAECQPMVVLRDPIRKLQLEILPDKSYPYLQLYTPPHRNSIAIENLSAAPDAFNNGMGLKTLVPGESINFATTFKIRATGN